MEKDLDLKYVCKLCDKRYPCGKSLGGHMRSHVVAQAADNSAGLEENHFVEQQQQQSMSMMMMMMNKKVSSLSNEVAVGGGGAQAGGYGLRENPKKTRRAVDAVGATSFPLPQERVCKQCGKGFQSSKALCGHMASHSEKDKLLKDDHSWTSDNANKDSLSDTDQAEDLKRQTRSKSRRYKKVVVKSPQFPMLNNNADTNNNGGGGSSSVTETDEVQVEEVAKCLMMLSKDSWTRGVVDSVVESSDNNSIVLETKSSSIEMKIGGRGGGFSFGEEAMDIKKLKGNGKLKVSGLDDEGVQYENFVSGYRKNGGKKFDSKISVDELLRNGEYKNMPKIGNYYDIEQRNGLSKGKEFGEFGTSSSSAMRRKRTRDDSSGPKFCKEAIQKMLYDSSDEEQSKTAYKKSKYECLDCNKVFSSFQGLGGHRPCHKRTNAAFSTKYDYDEDITPDSTPIGKLSDRFIDKKPVAKDFPGSVVKKSRSKKSKAHECPICHRLFKSGQALGGHKRSHFINGSDEFTNPTVVIKQEPADTHSFIDLNLPAPEQEEDADEDDQFVY